MGTTPLVWAVDTRPAPLFWFPRDCPRGCTFWRQVANSTLGFSGSRLRNAAPHPDQFD